MPTYIPLTPIPVQLQDSVTSVNMSGGSLEFYLTGTSTPTNLFSDDIGTSIGTSISLNSGGFPESGGNVIALHYDAEVEVDIAVKNAAGTEITPRFKVTSPLQWLTADSLGELLNYRTAAEIAAAVTPTDYEYPEGDVRRYGAAIDGTTDTRAEFVIADSIGVEIIVAGGLEYVIASDLTITNPVRIEASSRVKPSTGATVTFSSAVVIDHNEQAFSGEGAVALTIPQVVKADWWDRTSSTCIQDALDATAQGSSIQLSGKYTTTGIEVSSDEANQTGDIGKSLEGVGGPGTRIRDKTSGNWGAEIYLDDASDDDVIDFNGTDQGSNNGSRFSFVACAI